MRVRAKLTRSLTHRIAAVFGAALLLAGSIAPIIGAHTVSADALPQNFPKISFTFDDGLQSAVTKAEPTLAKYGLTGTDYVITGCADKVTDVNGEVVSCLANPDATYMSWTQVEQLQASGWEIGSHTETHPQMNLADGTKDGSLTGGTAQVDQELSGSKADLAAHGINATDFAWPYGDYDNAALADAAKYYTTTRGFADDDTNTVAAPGVSDAASALTPTNSVAYNDLLLHDQQAQDSPVAPTWQLCSTNGTVNVALTETCIDNAIKNNQWLVLVFHNVTDTPDMKAADSSYDIATSNLDAIAKYAAAKQTAGLAKVVNINDGIVTGANMMPNGDFTDGVADGWTTDSSNITADSNNNGRFSATDPNGPAYSISLKGNSDGSEGHLESPEIAVTQGQTYVIKNYVNLLNGGSVNFYVDEYDASGNKLAGQDPDAGIAYDASGTDVADIDFSYTPSADAAYASLQVIVKGATTQAYYDGAQFFIPGSTSVADTTPPVISNVVATANDQSSATVTWTTDEPSTSQVNYGTTTSYSNSTTDSTLTTTHTVTLIRLSAGTPYHFQVASTDAAGNTAAPTDDYMVTTLPAQDTTPPVFTDGPTVSNITSTSAILSWTTDEPSNATVNYGLDSTYGTVGSIDTTYQTTHSIELDGLVPSTAYHFDVAVADAVGNPATSGDLTFTTLDNPVTTPSTLTIINRVVNDNGGVAAGNDFGITINGTPAVFDSGTANGSNTTDYTSTQPISVDTKYELIEPSPTDYTVAADWNCIVDGTSVSPVGGGAPLLVDFQATEGQSVTCTIVNDDNAGSQPVDPGDISGPNGVPDGVVDIYDLSVLASHWLQPNVTSAQGDITGPEGIPDGVVDIYDLSKLASEWSDQ